MLRELRKSFSYAKKKKTKRILVNDCLFKQNNLPHQLIEPDNKEYSNPNSLINLKSTKVNETKAATSPKTISSQGKSITIFKTKSKAHNANHTNRVKSKDKKRDIKEDNLIIKDDRTIDSTQQNKLHRNSSHGTFSINRLNISSGSFNKPNKKVKQKLMNDYLSSISKDFWNKDIQQHKEEFYQNYENNINMFEGWIQQIKSEGFEQNIKELNEKKDTLNNLAEQVLRIQKKVVNSKKGMGDKDARLVRYKSMIQKEMQLIEKNKEEREAMIQEINELKKENQLFPSQTELTKEETRIMNEQFITEKNNIVKLAIEIQQVNAKITNFAKEKETLQTSLKVLIKQNEAYRMKITNTYRKSSNFMIDVNNLVNNPELFSK